MNINLNSSLTSDSKKQAVGVDFGTTNTAIALIDSHGKVVCATFPSDDGIVSYCRSVMYCSRESEDEKLELEAGNDAITLYLARGSSGRLIQSIKSFLGSHQFSSTNIYGRVFSLEEIISYIMSSIKEKAEKQLGQLGTRAVIGRPVRFAGAHSDEDNEFALNRLRNASTIRSFSDVVFEYEPVAAAYSYEQRLEQDELVLIADFGGGTSDFSLLHLGPSFKNAHNRADGVIGSSGVGIAGDSFDKKMVRELVIPELGYGSSIRSFGKLLPMPNWIYANFERWHYLSFLKSRKTMSTLHDIWRDAVEPNKIEALIYLVEHDLGFRLYQSIEKTKTELSFQTATKFIFNQGPITIEREVLRQDFDGWIAEELAAIAGCVDDLLARCQTRVEDVDSVFITGGTSYVPAVKAIFNDRFGIEKVKSGNNLTSVAEGLAFKARELLLKQ